MTQAMPRKNSEPRKNQFAVTLGRWAFVIPVLTINMIVVIIPSVIGLGIAFTDWTGYNVPNFIGLDNFQRLFQD